jgi:hypothetical protein
MIEFTAKCTHCDKYVTLTFEDLWKIFKPAKLPGIFPNQDNKNPSDLSCPFCGYLIGEDKLSEDFEKDEN